MNGAIPPNNNLNWLAHAERTSTSESIHKNEDSFSVRAAHQRGEQTLFTNISTDYQSSLPSTSKASQTAILNALQSQDALSISHQNIKNHCSETCIELLTEGAWTLDPEFYKNDHQIDILMGLYLAGEISFRVHAENPSNQGVFISYDGYSEPKLTQFIKNKLDIAKHYIIRTGSTNVSGLHFAICYFDSCKGWIVEDKRLGLNQLTNITGSLAAFGQALLAPYADWGPYDEQNSIIFIEATPRRIAILSEYLLRYRYYGEMEASTAMHKFDRSTGSFSQRPTHTYSSMFPLQLDVPIDSEAMQYTAAVTSILDSASKFFVPYENGSVERTLLILAENQAKFNLGNKDALNTHPIDLVKALIKAEELNPKGVFDPREDRDDCYADMPYYIASCLQKLNKTKSFFMRIGINSTSGHYFALKYVNRNSAYPSGWYYYGKQNEMQSDTQDRSSWFLLADSTGILTQEGRQICFPNIIWGKEANGFSLQFIEATEARQHMLQRYVSCFRHVSSEAAFAVLDQYAQARIRAKAEDKLEAEQLALDPQSVTFSSFLAQSNSEDLLNDLSTIIGQENSSKQPIYQAPTDKVIDLEIQKHIDHLNKAVQNTKECLLNRVKFMAMSMILQNITYGQIIWNCRKYWMEKGGRGSLFLTEEKLPTVKNFYLKGGLLLLRGLPISGQSSSYTAEVMKAIIDIMETNKTLGVRSLLDILEEKIKNNLITGIELEELPVSPSLNIFIKRCGYLRLSGENRYGDWVFDPNLTANISGENLPAQIFDQPQMQFKMKFSRKTKKRENDSNLTYYQQTRLQTKRIRAKIGLTGTVYSGDEPEALQKEELEKAIEIDNEREEDKLKFNIVLNALAGKNKEQIKESTAALASKLKIRNININDKVISLMVNAYSSGGLTLLRGFPASRGEKFSPNIMKSILQIIEKNPNFGCKTIKKRLIDNFKVEEIPSDKAIEFFLLRCGYDWSNESHQWK